MENYIDEKYDEINPDASDFQVDLKRLAGILMFKILRDSLDDESKDKTKAIKTYVEYRSLVKEDIPLLVSEIKTLSPEKTKLLKAELESRALTERVKAGKGSLTEIYNINVLKPKKVK